MDENELWMLSYYRVSEIGGAMFFGRLARTLPPGMIQSDMTQHFADEAQHAALWTKCIRDMGAEPVRVAGAYQDQYLAATGKPANLMEVLAITQVFEQRVLRQYSHHLAMPEAPEPVRNTLLKIMDDERWHISWIRRELQQMESRYGRAEIQETLRRMQIADREVYNKMTTEHAQRAAYITSRMS
jgi:bacterioferritin (cytochrome b1)